MADSYFKVSNLHLSGRISIDPQMITGRHQMGLSVLRLPIEYHVNDNSAPNNNIGDFMTGISVNMYWPNKKNFGGELCGTAHSKPLSCKVTSGSNFELLIPLDRIVIEHIEKTRKGDVTLGIEVSTGIIGYKQLNNTILCAFPDSFDVEVDVTIPRSNWVKILEQLGACRTALIEVPYSFDGNDDLPDSAKELDYAYNYFIAGDYDKTVSHCRTALEKYGPKEKIKATLKPVLDSSSQIDWLSTLTSSTYTWLEDSLNATYRIANKSHHYPSMGHFSRNEAQGILLISGALLSILSKVIASVGKKDK